MKASEAKIKIQIMHDWLMTPVGRYMLEWEENLFQTLSADTFGFNALQIGFSEINALKDNRIKNRWVSNQFFPEPPSSNPTDGTVKLALIHDIDRLPFASESIDLIILPHAFEFAENPHMILREVDRVLIPEGQVIISGFNPASLWGLRQSIGKLTGAYFLPSYAEFIGLPRLKDWLKLLNFEINRGHFGCYRPPCRTRHWLKRFAFIEKAGNRWWPFLGGVYLIQAIKRVHGIHLIDPAFRKRPHQLFQTIPVNHKTSGENPDQTS